MTDNDIRDYIDSLEEPLLLREIMSELREDDPTISFKRVARILRELGFENKPCTNVRNPKGKGSAWFRTGNTVTTCGDDDDDYEVDEVEEVDEDFDEADENDVYDAEKTEDTEDTKAKTRSTADALRDVDAQNAVNAELSAKLFESLNRSRSLKEELMQRQRDALLELARRILGLYGSEKERKTYGDF